MWQEFEHPVYAQLRGEFVPFMSALDLLLNCGEASGDVLEAGPGAGVRPATEDTA